MTSADQTLAEIEALLAHLPRLSRPLISRYFRSGFSVEQKPDNSPVTSADRAVEAELRQAIAKAFPAHAIIGEEQGGEADQQICWVIDPIDGTRAFVIGKPLFGTLVGVARGGVPFAGLIDMPGLDETYVTQDSHSYLITDAGRTKLPQATAAICKMPRLPPPARKPSARMVWPGLTGSVSIAVPLIMAGIVIIMRCWRQVIWIL